MTTCSVQGSCCNVAAARPCHGDGAAVSATRTSAGAATTITSSSPHDTATPLHDDVVAAGVGGEASDAWAALANNNVTRVLLFCLLDGAAYSIWQQQVFQVLIHQLAGDTAVGWMSAASGVTQMGSAVVAGLWGDALPRHTVLRAGAVAGLAAVLLSAYGIYRLDMRVLYAAQTLWGAYAGIVATGTEAIYADSVATGRRAFVYNVKWMVQTLSSCVGLIATIALLVHLGNEWERGSMVATIYVGLCVHPLAMLTLCSLHDRFSLHEEHALTYVAVREHDDDVAAAAAAAAAAAGTADDDVAAAAADTAGSRCRDKKTSASPLPPQRGVVRRTGDYALPASKSAVVALTQSSSTLHLLAPHDDSSNIEVHDKECRPVVMQLPVVRVSDHDAAVAVCQVEDVRANSGVRADEDEELQPCSSSQDAAAAAAAVETTTTTTLATQPPLLTTTPPPPLQPRLSCEMRAKTVARELELRDEAAWREYAMRQAALVDALRVGRDDDNNDAAHGSHRCVRNGRRVASAYLQRLRNAVCFYAALPFTWSAVPYLVCLVDFLVAFGSGMTLRYLNLYFVEDYATSPSVLMTATLLTCPTQAAFSCLVQYSGDYYVGRIPATILIRVAGASLLLLMGVTHLPLAVLLPIFVLRNAMTNSVRGVTRSVIMDAVRRENRAKWSAFESFSSFTWSGSAIIGGYIAEAHSYQYTFTITSFVHYAALAVLAPAIVGAHRVERELMRAKREKAAARKLQRRALAHARAHG